MRICCKGKSDCEASSVGEGEAAVVAGWRGDEEALPILGLLDPLPILGKA
jgi:hypothetical protein